MILACKRCITCHCSRQLALPACGRDETTPLCRNQLQATQTAWNRGDPHHYSPGALPGVGCTPCWHAFDFKTPWL